MKADIRQQSRLSCLKVKLCSYFETNKIQDSTSYVEAIWEHVLQDTIINGEHLWTISTKFDSKSLSSFKEKPI